MDKNGIVSATLAEIYLEQGYLEKAIAIYDQLVLKEPDNQTYKAKVASLKKTFKEKNKTSLFKKILRNKNR
jgi:thioredoxin-like negative regulator of GroEL